MAKQTKRAKRTTGKKSAPKKAVSKTASKKAAPKTATPTCMSNATAVGKVVSMPCSRVLPTEEQIRARAYDIYKRRAGHYGDANHDWVQAERELMRELTR